MNSQWSAGHGRYCLGALVAATLATAFAANLIAAPFEKSLPKDAVVLVNIPNVTELKAKIGETNYAEMLHDEAMKPFVDNLTGEVTLLLDTAEQITNISVPEIFALPTGQVSVAVKLNPDNPQGVPHVYFLADCKGKEDSLKDILSKISNALEENGISKETVGDISVYAAGEQQIGFAVKGSVLAIGNEPESLASVLETLEAGSDDSVGATDRFAAFRDRAGGASHVEVFVDLVRGIELASDMGQPEVATAIAMLGLNAFDAAGITFSFGENDNDMEAQVLVTTKGSSPIFNLFKMPAKPIKPESWVPADVVGYTSFNWDLELFYNTLIEMVNAVQPGAMEQVETMLAGPDPNNPLLNIKTDLIGPLGNRVTLVTDYVVEESTPNPRVLIALELENADKLTELLDRLMALAGGALPLETKSVKGNTVYTFPLGDLVAAQVPEGQMPFKLGVFGFTITKTHFMLTTHVELLDKCLNTTDGGLVESDAYKRLAAKMPASVSLMGVSRDDEQGRASWDYFKSGKLAEAIRQAMESQDEIGAFLGGIIDALDGSNLPEFEKVAKYFVPSGSYAIMDEKGIVYKTFVPKR